jgi:hypothetical protein
VRRVLGADPSLKVNTIHGNIWDLDIRLAEKVYKPSRGLFRLVEFGDKETDQLKPELVPTPPKKISEGDSYAPFADWLVNDLEERTKAISLGGNRFRDTWGTPDVIGKGESKRSDILQAPTEIVSAEIKTGVGQLVTAFGRACAYAEVLAAPANRGRLPPSPIRLLGSVRYGTNAWCPPGTANAPG